MSRSLPHTGLRVLRVVSIALVAAIAVLLILAVLVSPGETKAIRDASGTIVQGSIAEASMMELGGVEQFVLIRGRDRANPVLLLLHGGPGDAQAAMFRYYNSALEDQFVVVNWDQRGAGRSYAPDTDWGNVTEERILEDAHELSLYLRKRFPGGLILAGHSWGSHLGMQLAHRYPELYAAYVGIGQVADQARSEMLSFESVLAKAEAQGRQEAVRQLSDIGPPDRHGNYAGGTRGLGVQRRWVREFGGAAHGKQNLEALMLFGWPLVLFPEYRLRDKVRYLDAEARSMEVLEDDLLHLNLMREVQHLCLPLFIFQGSHDLQTVTSLTRRYFDDIDAPHKEFIEFRQAAHLVPYEEPARFHRELVERVRPWAVPRSQDGYSRRSDRRATSTCTSDEGLPSPHPQSN